MNKKHEDKLPWSTFVIDGKKYCLYAVDIDRLKDLEEDERERQLGELIKNKTYYDTDSCIDVYSKGDFTQSRLSNFCACKFYYDGVEINSIEGFLQSLKTPEINLQKEICKLVGKGAKAAGHEIEFDGSLYWNGEKIDRFSPAYHELLKEIYRERVRCDENFRKALNQIGNKELVHTIGNDNPEETILTTDEFIDLLKFSQSLI